MKHIDGWAGRLRALQSLRKFVVAFAIATGVPSLAYAQMQDDIFRKSNYRVLVADFNGDGRLDVLMKSVPRVMILDVDELSFLAIPSPGAHFAMISDPDGNYVLIPNPDATLMNFAGWQSGNSTWRASPAGGASGTFVIRSPMNKHPDFTVSMDGASGQLQLLSAVWPGFGTSCS